MNPETFRTQLLHDGYDDIALREVAANTFNARHSHDFDVRALMLDGELTLAWNDDERTFRSGEVFVMDAGCPHIERFGPDGARYLVGRRHAAV